MAYFAWQPRTIRAVLLVFAGARSRDSHAPHDGTRAVGAGRGVRVDRLSVCLAQYHCPAIRAALPRGAQPAMRFVSDASYWIYLVHLPIVLLLQTIIVPWQVNVWVKFSGTVLVTFVLCMATYVVFVRYTPVGWMLNGKRKFP